MNNAVKLYDYYFNFYEKTYEKSSLNEKEGHIPKQLKRVDNDLPEQLESKNDFYEAKRLIDDIRIDMNKVKVGKADKKAFNDLNRLITDISNNKVKKEDAVERLEKSMLDLNQLRER